MYDYKSFLTPINPELSLPEHTEIKIQCFICKHFPVCNIRLDYLKTAQLIQNVLGEPNKDFELCCSQHPIPDFEGTIIENYEEYFPKTVVNSKGKEGTFFAAKFIDSKNINFVYIFNGYYVLFKAIFNEETLEFDIQKGIEVCYKIEFEIAEDLELLQLGLLSFKEDLENIENTETDVINTTAFSADLNCKFYEWEKGLDYYEGIRRIIAKYPNGIPLGDDGEYYHLATYHKEKDKVPCYTLPNKPTFMPMPYPVYYPPKVKRCSHTRDELNEF